MKKVFFYIIISSQIWLSFGSLCTHYLFPDTEFYELIGEEEKEKEKEIEKEIEKINATKDLGQYDFEENDHFVFSKSEFNLLGRKHLDNLTQPPEHFNL